MPLIKPKIAFFDFTGCEGCQLMVIDTLQTHPELLGAVEIVQFREAISRRENNYQIAFIEGSCTRSGDESRLATIRAQAEIVIALGACAHIGGINTIRNLYSSESVRRQVYGEAGKLIESYLARPIEAVIPIEGFIPGCPINRQEFVLVLKTLLQGRLPKLPDYPVCVECKLQENRCVFLRSQYCLGPVTRAGCGAICPGFGLGCDGCRGLLPDAELDLLSTAVNAYGVNGDDIRSKEKLFLSYQLVQREVGDHGSP